MARKIAAGAGAAKRRGARARVGVETTERYAWLGPSLLICTPRVECDDSEGLTGYYYREARHLRTLRLRINGATPWLCAEGGTDPNALTAVYVYPELTRFGGGGTDVSDDSTWTDDHGVYMRAIDVRVEHVVEPCGMTTTLTLANRSTVQVALDLVWELAADFADVQEAFSGNREQSAPVETASEANGVVMRYRHPQLPLETRATADGATWQAIDTGLATRITLDSRAEWTSRLLIRPSADADCADTAARLAAVARWRERLATFETPHDTMLADIVNQAAADVGSFASLTGPRDEWLAVHAGIPLYPAFFGRDAITVGWQSVMADHGQVLDAALTRLGRLQSDRVLDWTDEQPGRIPYQVRTGPLARLGVNPYAGYFADFASPLAYVIALAHHFAWRGDEAFLRRHWDTARRILDWARTYGDPDGDGYLEYRTRSPKGTKNQGWKDSGNAILYEDGRPVPAPLGTCELQGYWYAAQELMAVLCWALGEREDGRAHWQSAIALKERFNRDWWMEDEGFVALALDADKRLARTIASNAGHCLAAGILDDEHIPPVVERLMARDLFSGWGVRTLSSDHPSYNPIAYHLGTVWSVENSTIVFGLRRYGFDVQATHLAGAMFDLARLYERGRVPECVGGYARSEFAHPGAYPRANPIQAWNQSGLLLTMQSLLGLQPVATLHTMFVDPTLPMWMPEVTVRGLRLGDATATLHFWRDDDGASHAEIVDSKGPFHLVRQPPPEALGVGVRDRLRALVETVRHH